MFKKLTNPEKTIISSLAELLFPMGGDIELEPPGRIIERAEVLFDKMDIRKFYFFRFLTGLFEISALFSKFLKPFSRMTLAERQEYAEYCKKSWVRRVLFQSLKMFYGMFYLSVPGVKEKLGYDGTPLNPSPNPLPPPKDLPVIAYPDLKCNTEETVDVVVVGSGAGGATIAAELSEAGYSVIVVEEGREANRDDFYQNPVDRLVDFYRENSFSHTVGNPVISVPMGCVVGGTTVVNSGTCLKTPSYVLKHWTKNLGLKGLEPEQAKPIFDKLWKDLNVHTSPESSLGNNAMIMKRGAEAMGLNHHSIEHPLKGCQGSGQCALGCPTDSKLDMRLTYLPKAVHHGAKIFARCKVERILTAGWKATGIKASILDKDRKKTGFTLTVKARAVVLSAGAIYTPSLLMYNKLGNQNVVGRHLKIHPATAVGGVFDEEIYGWKGLMQSYCVDHWKDDGYLIEATYPPPEIGYVTVVLPYTGHKHKVLVSSMKRMSWFGIMVSDTTSGRVRNIPGNNPWIFYLLNRVDTRKILEAVASSCRIMLAAGAKEVYSQLPGLEVIRHEEDIENIFSMDFKAEDLKLSAYHPQGTCRMGKNPQTSVTDSFGAVHGVKGLWIADASLIPSPPHVNPQMTIMMLSNNVAQNIKENLG